MFHTSKKGSAPRAVWNYYITGACGIQQGGGDFSFVAVDADGSSYEKIVNLTLAA